MEIPGLKISAGDERIELVSDRLLLRRFGFDEGALLTLLDSDPEVMRFINDGGPPRPDLDAEAVKRFQALYSERPGLGFFAAHLRSTGDYLGWFHFRPDRTNPADVDLGYRLMRKAWGQGLATEGSLALVSKGFSAQGVETVVAYALLANRGSWRVMEKIGMIRTGEFIEDRFPGSDQRAVKYALTKSDFADRGPRAG